MGRKKSILFGSIFVLALILLMPSIPAIEQKTIEDKAYSDIIEEIKTLDDDVKLPNLYAFIVSLLHSRWELVIKLFDFAVDRNDYGFKINHPIVLLLAMYVEFTLDIRIVFWRKFSNKLNLDWTMDYSIFHDE